METASSSRLVEEHAMMHHVRPHKVLEMFETGSYVDRLVTVVLPDRWSKTTLETAIILAVAKYVRPQRYFEFGTFLGVTTLTIAANFPDCTIETLDLDESSFAEVSQHPNDEKLSRHRLESEDRIAFLNTPYESKITRHFGDSNTYDLSRYYEQMNMVYIDGGHDLPTVRADTENAFRMLDIGRLGCIMWHDYGHASYSQLTQYLDELAVDRDLTHVEDSTTVFMLHRP